MWGGLPWRFVALFIDGALVVGSLIVLSILVALISGEATAKSNSTTTPTATLLFGVIWWIFALMYNPACWYVFGATLGQKVLGLRVARASDGQALGLGAVLVRFTIFSFVTGIVPLATLLALVSGSAVLGIVSLATISIPVISVITAWKDPFKRSWHDIVARSVVVRNGW